MLRLRKVKGLASHTATNDTWKQERSGPVCSGVIQWSEFSYGVGPVRGCEKASVLGGHRAEK